MTILSRILFFSNVVLIETKHNKQLYNNRESRVTLAAGSQQTAATGSDIRRALFGHFHVRGPTVFRELVSEAVTGFAFCKCVSVWFAAKLSSSISGFANFYDPKCHT